MPDVKMDDEVRIVVRNHYRKMPEGGYVGKVTKVGRKYATAAYTVMTKDWHDKLVGSERTIEFDMETGRERGNPGNYAAEVITPAEAERRARHATALSVLQERKVRLESGHGMSLEQIEALAALVESFPRVEAG
jgi:hypothetical protein